ncbi:serine/threonine-protein kinase [Aeromicrobium sp. CTD01-1L150]|uniref:serine/threonine-protein kinase n=1 Tax=Aeromicrobium sp. CTD01-1L150 TaxID=3341830 RepID=UPI0035C21981
MNTSSDLPASTVLDGRYQLEGVIGRGRTSTVYRARDLMHGRAVAVKVIVQAAGSVEALQRQTSRTRIGTVLDHQGVVAVHDVHIGEDPSYLVLELIEGRPLSELQRRGGMPPGDVAEIGAQLCWALAAVHGAGIVHNDMDPSNVLVGPGATPSVTLTDFGIARFSGLDRLASTSQPVGTTRYLSPEQASRRGFGRSADVYGAGLILLECLTGEPAFPGDDAETTASRLARDPLLPASLGPQWSRVLRAMTARDPRARPDASALSRELAAMARAATPPEVVATPTTISRESPPTTPAAKQAPVHAAAPAAQPQPEPAPEPQPEPVAAAVASTSAPSSPVHRGTRDIVRRTGMRVGSLVSVGALLAVGVLLSILVPGPTVSSESASGAAGGSDPGRYDAGRPERTQEPAESGVPSPDERELVHEPVLPPLETTMPVLRQPSTGTTTSPSSGAPSSPSQTDEPTDPPATSPSPTEPSPSPTDPTPTPTDEPTDPTPTPTDEPTEEPTEPSS